MHLFVESPDSTLHTVGVAVAAGSRCRLRAPFRTHVAREAAFSTAACALLILLGLYLPWCSSCPSCQLCLAHPHKDPTFIRNLTGLAVGAAVTKAAALVLVWPAKFGRAAGGISLV